MQKPNGRVRGIVIGDMVRRLVSRSLAQMYSQHIHASCSPHQFALSTRAGTEAVIHALTAATQANPTHTVLSVDGIGAYDTISRESMLRGLMTVPTANRSLPFVRTFYCQPSQYVWHDDQGRHHLISQAEGGEQGDPLMPALFSLGQSTALQAIHSQLHPTETLLAYLDDIYAVVAPDRVRTVYDVMANELRTHTRIQLNSGKTRVWNAAGATPPGLEALGPEVWVGNTTLPREQQGITILGAPLGTAEYVAQQLLHSSQSHQALLERIPTVDDLQSAWLLLLFCASPRCNHTLRTTPPQLIQDFATRHDTSVAACLPGPLGLPSNQPSHGTPPTLPGRLRSDFSHSHRTASLLGIMGGHLSSPSTPIAVARRHAPAITSPPTSTATSVPGGHRRGTNLGASWVATARLACTHTTGQSPTPQPFGGTTSQPRLATQGCCHANLHDLPKRVANGSRPSQQSNARITNRPIRQSNIHHHPFRPGVHIPTRPVPHSSAPSFASPAPAVCASLPVPSLS